MIKSIFSTLILLLLFSACSEPASTDSRQKVEAFFDLKTYFQKEMKRLENKKNVKKIAVYNGEKEEQEIENIDFSKELLIFSNADINRVAWRDKYSKDSTFTADKKLKSLQYKALDNKLKTRSLQIDFKENGVISEIQIITAGESLLSETENELNYNPVTGYSIQSSQDVTALSENKLKIEVLY